MLSELRASRTFWALGIALTAAVLSLGACQAQGPAAPPLRVGLVPKESPDKTRADFEPLRRYLEEKVGRPVEVIVPTDYTAVVEAMAAGKVDVAYFGALTYIQASNKTRLRPFVKAVLSGTHLYHSVIITRKDSPIEKLTDLKGKTFAFGDISSTSGHLVPHQGLLDAGVDPKRDFREPPFYTGAHNATALAVYNGRVDGGAVEEPVLVDMVRQGLTDMNRLKVIWRSAPIPQYPWVVREAVDTDTQERLEEAFLAIKPEDKLVLPTIAETFVPATAEDYAELRRMAEALGMAGKYR